MTDDAPFVVDRSPRGLVVVHGPDATSFLQSIVSQDLDPLGVGESARSLLLTPQGKLDAEFRVHHVGDDEWWMDTEAGDAAHLAESLARFKIRVKAEIEDRTADTGMLSFVGTTVEARDLLLVQTSWGDRSGVDAIGPSAAVRAVDGSLRRLDADEFEAFRIASGVPRYGIDIDEKTIPQEAFLEADAVSLTKGCFLGQELVARIDSRGHVNRHLRRLTIDGSDVPPAGAEVVAGEKTVGTVTSAAAVPGEQRVVMLGMVRREVEPPADVTVRWDDREVPARVMQGA